MRQKGIILQIVGYDVVVSYHNPLEKPVVPPVYGSAAMVSSGTMSILGGFG